MMQNIHIMYYLHFSKNDLYRERATIYFMRSVGNSNRFIGLFIALSSNLVTICIKIECFKEELYNIGINEDLLEDIIRSNKKTI